MNINLGAFRNKLLLPDMCTSINRNLDKSNKFFLPLGVRLIEVQLYIKTNLFVYVSTHPAQVLFKFIFVVNFNILPDQLSSFV